MRKLDKKLSLATDFKKWYENNKKHIYNSTNNKYYYDVLYELLIIQEGLCAYTEYRLIDENALANLKKGFKNGRYSIDLKPNIPAHLEHFNSTLKNKDGWNWSNFFAVFGAINNKKGTAKTDNILKPDTENYNPNLYLAYDKDLHLFYANLNLDKLTKEKVNAMILILGLNNDFIKMKRKDYLQNISTLEYFTSQKQEINQFHTAYNFLSL